MPDIGIALRTGAPLAEALKMSGNCSQESWYSGKLLIAALTEASPQALCA